MVKLKTRPGTFVREPDAVYGATANVVEVMPAELLQVGVDGMQEPKEKALAVGQALGNAGVPHAVVGGLALSAHWAPACRLAERATQDLVIWPRKVELKAAPKAISPWGYRYRKAMRLHAFMPLRHGTHFAEGFRITWAGEKVRPKYLHPTPELNDEDRELDAGGVCYLSLPALLKMKLTSLWAKGITHVQNLIQWKLLTLKVEASLPADLRERHRKIKQDYKKERLY
ncbi:MAG: hypothetical protein AMXMBFR7_13030 [Planctomycetota bacterium]